MINLVKNEFTKIFHKKSIYVVLIITLGFMILSAFLERIFTEDFFNQYLEEDDMQYVKQQLALMDKDNPDTKEEYISLQAQLKTYELSQKYDKDSWQRYIINYKAYDLIENMLRTEGTDEYSKNKKAFDEFTEKINKNDWKTFAQDELKDINTQIAELEKMEKQKEQEEFLISLKEDKQILEWRLQKDIPFGDSEYNNILMSWKGEKQRLRDIENQAKTKELEHSEKYEKQQIEANIKIYEYAMQNDLSDKIKLTMVNSQTALATNEDANLVQSICNYGLFVTIAIVIIAGTSVSEEFNKGTVKLLLVRPYTRIKILFAKFFASLGILAMVYVVVAILQYLVGGFANGFGEYVGKEIIYNFNTNSAEEIGTIKYLVLTGVAILPQHLLIMTLAFFLSVVFTNSALAIGLPMLGMMGADIINELALSYKKAEFIKYFVTPNWDLRIYLFGRLTRFEPISFEFSIGICIIYFVSMLIVSAMVFKKKEIKNI